MKIKLPEEINYQNCKEFGQELWEKCRRENKEIILDFKNVQFISSEGLGKLLKASKICKDKEIKIKIINTTQTISDFFKMIELDKIFDISY